jgi:negative regulator of sigma E activity
VKYIEEATAEIIDVIQKATWSATPDDKSEAKYPEYRWKDKDLIKGRQKLRRRWQMSRQPEDNADTTRRPEN